VSASSTDGHLSFLAVVVIGHECLFVCLQYETLIGKANEMSGNFAISHRRLFTKRYLGSFAD